MKDHSKWTSHL